MRVVGVLEPAESADDDAVFVDLKTAWVIEGLAHGHEDLSRPEAKARVLERKGRHVVGNASVVEYNEITDANADSFHFHGDPSGFPITAVIAAPPDTKRLALLMGRYEATDETYQILRPREVMDELLGTILTVQSFVVAAFALLAVATLGTAALVFALSIRLRRREIETMVRIGGSRRHVAAILAFEVVVVLAAGVCCAALLTGVASLYGPELIRAWIT